MNAIDGGPVLTTAAMRAAEERAVAKGTPVAALMHRAGEGVAAAVARLSGGAPVLVLCGPGNNGGDGFVAARLLANGGADVRVAAMGEPTGEAAKEARLAWSGPISTVGAAQPAAIMVDALFGIGLSRPLEDSVSKSLMSLVEAARLSIAVDLPSGVRTDTGAVLGDVPGFDLTLALGAVKPAHLLQPAAHLCGAVRLIDIGVEAHSAWRVIDRPRLPVPGPESHKYTRGMVAIISGSMAGAALLASTAAMRSGAGYVTLLGGASSAGPHALVHKPFDDAALNDPRIGALLIGPGLGRDDQARERLERVLATDHPLVIDGDALHLLAAIGVERLKDRRSPAILTPHAGEFAALFGGTGANKIDATIAAAERSGAIVVFKGADTVIADANGQVRLATDASDWLSTAGTGDVLAGVIAGTCAAGVSPLDAAAAGVWMHGAAARRLPRAFIADDLLPAIGWVRARL